MSLVQTYLENNGYDYYGNAAEDTLVFFVRNEDAPEAEETDGRSNEAITNLSDDTVNGISGGLSSEASAVNTETHAEAYKANGKDMSANFSLSGESAPADNEYNDAPDAGSIATPDSNTDANDFSESVPKMTEMDSKQTDTEHSKDSAFKA